MYCSTCGTELAEGVVFCSRCGQQVGTQVATVVRSSGWLASTRKRVWRAIGLAWACGLLYFGVLQVPMAECYSVNQFIAPSTGETNHEIALRAPLPTLWKHGLDDNMTSYRRFLDRKQLFKDLLWVTLPALGLFAVTWVAPVTRD